MQDVFDEARPLLCAQFSPQAPPPQHSPPDSHGGGENEELLDLPPMDTVAADMSFLWLGDPQCGQTTSSEISLTLW
jgi:hypothetical protein